MTNPNPAAPLTDLIVSIEVAQERHRQGRLWPHGVSALLNDTLHVLRGLDAARATSTPAGLTCGCTVDAELGAGPVCPACGHRDHGRSGCRAALQGADR